MDTTLEFSAAALEAEATSDTVARRRAWTRGGGGGS